jgi:hypothetical protein
MVQRLVELQNGRCGYEAGDSHVFYFTLPTIPPAKPDATRPDAALKDEEVAA